MAYLLSVSITLVVLVGFLALVRYETRHHSRLFASQRAKLDARITRIEFIITHVDLGAFVRSEIERGMNHVGHSLAHMSLQVVRAAERLLTRVVRHFRTKDQGDAAPKETKRAFVKTLSDFKDGLRMNRIKADPLEAE